jgi:hypothetical protein
MAPVSNKTGKKGRVVKKSIALDFGVFGCLLMS